MSVRSVQPPAADRPRRGRPRVAGTEQRILDTALAMLAESGYAALRLDELARRAGVAKTTVLRRWPSKAAVVAAAVERLALHTVEVPESTTLRDDLHALLSNAVTVFGHGPGRCVPQVLREAGRHPEIAELLQTVIHTRRLGYRRAVGRAIARGELDPEIDQELLIDLLIGPLWTRLLITQDPLPPGDRRRHRRRRPARLPHPTPHPRRFNGRDVRAGCAAEHGGDLGDADAVNGPRRACGDARRRHASLA